MKETRSNLLHVYTLFCPLKSSMAEEKPCRGKIVYVYKLHQLLDVSCSRLGRMTEEAFKPPTGDIPKREKETDWEIECVCAVAFAKQIITVLIKMKAPQLSECKTAAAKNYRHTNYMYLAHNISETPTHQSVFNTTIQSLKNKDDLKTALFFFLSWKIILLLKVFPGIHLNPGLSVLPAKNG